MKNKLSYLFSQCNNIVCKSIKILLSEIMSNDDECKLKLLRDVRGKVKFKKYIS